MDSRSTGGFRTGISELLECLGYFAGGIQIPVLLRGPAERSCWRHVPALAPHQQYYECLKLLIAAGAAQVDGFMLQIVDRTDVADRTAARSHEH